MNKISSTYGFKFLMHTLFYALHFRCFPFIFPNTGTKMLILTGKPIIDGVRSEVLDLESEDTGEETRCRDFANFPKEMKGSTGVKLGRIPVICGGLYWEHRPLPTGMFKSFNFLKSCRFFAI